MNKFHIKHVWLIFGAYGVWFAIFSGLEEALHGKWWKMIISMILGSVVYFIFESNFESKNK